MIEGESDKKAPEAIPSEPDRKYKISGIYIRADFVKSSFYIYCGKQQVLIQSFVNIFFNDVDWPVSKVR